ncbi:MerR family transcriptional regulator [Betaproteobacteria bacterium]|nr:MerR family transcriptional regulator [Betaproteobacteria bacterium]
MELPNKKYFSIGEVASLCNVKPHVLRYWETEFPQLSPGKRRGNRRYYQANDVLLVSKIKFLLYEKGFTIYGAKLSLKEKPLIKDGKASNPNSSKEVTDKFNGARISAGDYETLKKEIRLVIDVLDGKIET